MIVATKKWIFLKISGALLVPMMLWFIINFIAIYEQDFNTVRIFFTNSVSKFLNEDGVALIHTIGSVMTPRDPHPWISKYIFPGGYTPSLSELAKPIEKSNLIIADMEVLRMHYAHTLRNWKSRFLGKKEEVLKMFDERFFRMWEFYLAGCEMAFKWGDQVVFQFQLSKKLLSTPNTRDYIY